MDTKTPSPRERLYQAVVVLASGEGRIQERLAASFWQQLCHIDHSGLPPSVREDFSALCTELKAIFGHDSRTSDLSETKAGEYARRLILVYDGVLRHNPIT